VPRARRVVPKHHEHHSSTRARKAALTCRERAAHTSGPSCARVALRAVSDNGATPRPNERGRALAELKAARHRHAGPSSRPRRGQHGTSRERRGGRAAGAARRAGLRRAPRRACRREGAERRSRGWGRRAAPSGRARRGRARAQGTAPPRRPWGWGGGTRWGGRARGARAAEAGPRHGRSRGPRGRAMAGEAGPRHAGARAARARGGGHRAGAGTPGWPRRAPSWASRTGRGLSGAVPGQGAGQARATWPTPAAWPASRLTLPPGSSSPH
jgi:hypothetical protein